MELPSLPFGTGRLDSVELVPFRAGIAAGAMAVMTSHLALPLIDPTGRPATLSRPVITGLLRRRLGFNGIVVTDGMRMQGITDHFSSAEAAINAIDAGADAVLGIADIDSAFRGVVAAVRSGRIPLERIDLSCRRILAAKEWAGLATKRTVSIDSIFRIVGTEEFRRTAEEISDASVTLLRNEGGVVPLKKTAHVTLVTVSEDPQPGLGIDLCEELEPSVALRLRCPGLQRDRERAIRRDQGGRRILRRACRGDLSLRRRLEGGSPVRRAPAGFSGFPGTLSGARHRSGVRRSVRPGQNSRDAGHHDAVQRAQPLRRCRWPARSPAGSGSEGSRR